jgi:predicted Rossmann fold nucleotide-binding protein DprA/Smf involved in DNA uptake
MKVAIVGSRKYENKTRIKKFIFRLIEKYGKSVTIVSGGCKDGADKYAKKYALELGAQYQEYPPFHEVHNLYCVLPDACYSKPYNVRYFFVRNKQIAQNSDRVVAFIPEGINSKGTISTLKYAKKFGKKVMVID